ncbi:hypothetical protein A3E39_00600 [Candidatus Uhrbacteria bacterium RIFCSPHIGHO2_12_FULL_60_25]|uniref:Uncharacterized protein n=1 Tax=Candidatus Uhrbacteria bacterium RIFCSPHIGHO2_12_FULL_60_25 TaxID=1802399 RepID=A0A1F7UMX0_9BACT|nr:MAG: hypothetical protein A3E39_00600 [Candidatus Uhrbacteria bacterium RIFCSPHIGHO2_12_FULL_60_25]
MSALVKNAKGEVLGLRTDEQLVTKTEAYRGVAARLRGINAELKDIAAAGRKGFERREAELNAEAKRFTDYLDKMEKGVSEEQAREAFREGAEVMVDNPFYTEEVAELRDEDIVDITEEPAEVEEGELVYNVEDLRKDYKTMALENHALGKKLQKLEAIQRTIVETISKMMEPGFKHRQALTKLQRDAMTIEDYQAFAFPLLGTEIQEAGDREEIRKKRLPQMLDAVTGQITRTSEQKVKLAEEIARTVKKIRELEKGGQAGGMKKAA